MTEASVTLARDFYVPAKGFVEAAKMVNQHAEAEGKFDLTFLPIHTLLGFALELYLKSWLAEAGYDEERLKNKFGHNLEKLCSEAQANGLPIVTGLDIIVPHLHGRHKDYTYRYFKAAEQYVHIDYQLLFSILAGLDRVVDQKIGASASLGLKPGH